MNEGNCGKPILKRDQHVDCQKFKIILFRNLRYSWQYWMEDRGPSQDHLKKIKAVFIKFVKRYEFLSQFLIFLSIFKNNKTQRQRYSLLS